jgi:hypothetical protein
MRSHITEIALAATLATALISATPALARDGQTSLALAAGHHFIGPTANHAWAKRNHNYGRGFSQRSGYQWDPWGHCGNYYSPMVGLP